MAFFECVIGGGSAENAIPLTVTCSYHFAGSIISIAKDGTTFSEQCPSSSPYQVNFVLPDQGVWTISGSYAGETFTEPVTITAYQATLSSIPNGETATPTDDIQTWLHCADIWDKNYTTISEVLGDTTSLLALISSNNAADYLARSSSWALDVCSNMNAMTYIGADDYCAIALLKSSDWITYIGQSMYFDSVLTTKVPTMTSDTTPSGIASASTIYSNSYRAWRAFDGNTAQYWCSANGAVTNQYVQYAFPDDVIVARVNYKFNSKVAKNCIIQSSKYGNEWDDVKAFTATADSTAHLLVLDQSYHGNYWRLFMENAYSTDYIYLSQLQFWGRAIT